MNDEILIRFIERQCSVEEAREILLWIESGNETKARFAQLQSWWASADVYYAMQKGEADQEEVRFIMDKIRRKRLPRYIAYYISAIAGVAAILLFFFFSPSGKEPYYDYEKALATGRNQTEITLTLQADKRIKLADTSVVVAYNRRGQIVINDTVEISGEKKHTLNTIHVPYGKRSTLILEDGTRVYLNSGSSLAYPIEFTANKREVYLDGEAYFEVAKESDRKFIVQTAYKAVEVLGTQFNVSIDKSLNKFEAVLVSGKIALDGSAGQIVMAPDQLYTFFSASGEEELKIVDPQDYISWINSKLKFRKEPLYNVLHKLEKVYNIQITLLKPEYKDYRISGDLDIRNTAMETLDVVMSILVPDYSSENQLFYEITTK